MNHDQIRGASRHLRGRFQTAFGGLLGDPGRQARGAFNQVAGGAQYGYGRARDRVEEFADDLAEDGRHLARVARHRGAALGRDAVRYADGHRTPTLLGIAALAFAAGWFAKVSR